MKEFQCKMKTKKRKKNSNGSYRRHALKHSWNSNVLTKLFILAHFPLVHKAWYGIYCNDGDRTNTVNNKSFQYRHIHTPTINRFLCVASHTNTLFYWHEASTNVESSKKYGNVSNKRKTNVCMTWFKWSHCTLAVMQQSSYFRKLFYMHEHSWGFYTIESFVIRLNTRKKTELKLIQ